MTAPSPSARETRAARRRRLQQRQTIVLGGLVMVLVLIALIAATIWAGLLPSPVQRDFSRDEDPDEEITVPCLPEGATAMDFSAIAVNVYNGTDRAGLAASVGESLNIAGALVQQEANWGEGSYAGTTRLIAGPRGIVGAYSLARAFPEAEVILEPGREDETVDVVLGDAYTDMLDPDEISELDSEEPLSAPQDCTPVDIPEDAPDEGEGDEGGDEESEE